MQLVATVKRFSVCPHKYSSIPVDNGVHCSWIMVSTTVIAAVQETRGNCTPPVSACAAALDAVVSHALETAKVDEAKCGRESSSHSSVSWR